MNSFRDAVELYCTLLSVPPGGLILADIWILYTLALQTEGSGRKMPMRQLWAQCNMFYGPGHYSAFAKRISRLRQLRCVRLRDVKGGREKTVELLVKGANIIREVKVILSDRLDESMGGS